MGISKSLTKKEVGEFQNIVFDFYHGNGRMLPWRRVSDECIIDPYLVTVSEIMLQQTQVKRVEQKFPEFINRFPTFSALANATLSDVLKQWTGLGYSRRAKYLHDFSKAIYDSAFPADVDLLTTHKGIGKNTAAAILVYSFNQRQVFIETNIRSVLIHHFFLDKVSVPDRDIENIVEQTLPDGSYREWYWALMDYGSHLKKNGSSHLAKARSYKKQSAFKGSLREVRSKILTYVIEHNECQKQDAISAVDDMRAEQALDGLLQDELLIFENNMIKIP